MYIFKNPKIGGEVSLHKDSSFLITDPLSVCGIWIALDEASKENGCMWGVPGSHLKDPTQFLKTRQNGDQIETYMDGPDDKYSQEGAIPLEVSAGSVVLLHGSFLHYSDANRSSQQRHAYTFHVVEGDYKYAEENWLKRDDFKYM